MRAALRAGPRPGAARSAPLAARSVAPRPRRLPAPPPYVQPPPPTSSAQQAAPVDAPSSTTGNARVRARARARARARGLLPCEPTRQRPPCSGGDDCAPGESRRPRPMQGCPPARSSQVKTSCARRVGAQGACRRVNPPRMLPTRPPPPPPPRSLAHADVGVRQGAGTGSTQSSPTPTSDDDARPAATRANTPTRPPSSEAAVQPWAQP